ncbi:uncharacterized protein TNCT_78751 [Trichonephila clavata]|uniref:Uncharacterized protein n=1 Tax=Trichonephila clavata TaxID=2740835 RepID=A0A8X6M2I7_TRICU|nr:uncharacterized protein TNCT_78751 [Trichonephila clavata]
MGWFIFLLLTSIIVSITGQTVTNENDESISVEEFEAQLQDEALKVLVQHSDEMSRIPKPPSFDMPQNFMRSFIPGTGVGNREELVIESIRKISVSHNSKYSQWHYKRFNSTDYVLAVGKRNVVLNKFDSSTQDSFTFLDKEQILHKPEVWSSVIDAAIFIRSIKRSVVLYVAVLTEEARTSFVTIYEVIGGTGVPVSLIDLGISPSTGQFEARKIAFVESQLGSSLVVLINSPYEVKVIPQQKGSSELNHYIEVQYPEAVDLVTFTVLGHGYIAVANRTSCDIYRFDKYAHSYLLFDRITSRADLTDLEYFRLGFHHYLAVSGRTEQYLYTWKSGEFSLTQTFSRFNISQIHASMLPTCRDDVILFLISDAQTYIYVYDGRNEAFILSNGDIPSNFVISPNSIASFTYKNKVEIIFQNFDNFEAYVIETSLKQLPNPFLVAGESVTDYMKNVQQKLEDQAKQVQNIKDVLKNAVRTTGDQHITAFQKFDNLRTNKEAAINLEKILHVEWNNTDLTLEQYKIGTENLEKSVAELEKLIEEIENIIPDVVRLDQDAEITGSKTFWGDVAGSSIQAYAVNLETVAGINVPQLQNEIYRLDKQQQIKGTLRFEETLTIIGNLEVEETVNNIDISRDVMTTNTKQTSSATIIFKKKVVVQGDLDLSGKLQDIDISEEVITLNGNHNITGKKSFQNGIVAVNVNTILLDGININELYDQALTKSGDQEITGTKTFNGSIITNDIILNGLLNGNNVQDLAESIVRVDQPAIITGNKTFLEDVRMESMLTVNGRVNGLRIPEDLFLTDKSQNVSGTKNFAGTVTAYNVIVEGTVDGLKIPDDIVTLSKDEEIFSNLFFSEGIHVEDDITVHGLVDGVDIRDLVRQAMKINESHTFEEAIFLGPVTITGRLSVDGTINGINLEDIVKDIVFKDEENIVIKSKKFFNKVKAETVNLEKMINGYNISVDFMKVDGDQDIKGTKLFKQPVTFKSLNIKDGMMGHLNVTQLFEHRLTLEIEDEVDKNVEFVDHVIVENLMVHGTIGGLKIPEDIVLKNSSIPIANKIFANKVITDNLIVNGNGVISGSFGGIDLEKFYNDRVSLFSEQDIHGDVWIGNSTAGTIELSGLINGIDIIEFASNVMSKTKDQVVWAEKIFRGEIIADGPITTEEGINRVNLADMNRRAFKLHSHNIVKELLEFEAVVVNDIKVSGLINGLNFTHLAEDGLRKRDNLQRVTGINTFEAGFEVNGNIEAETVNDLYLPIDILLKSPPQNITGQFTIQNLNVDGNVHVEGLVNGLDLSKIAPHIVRTDQESIIESDVIFLKPIHVSENVEVTGNVNGVDLKQIFDNILLKKGEQVIKGNKIIRGNVTIEGNIDVDYVNGFNWQAFLADVVRTDIPQVIRSPKAFLVDTEVNNLFAKKATATLVNGKILENFLNEVVFIDVPANITGRKEFKGDVEITGNLDAELINELRLRTDVITLACNNDKDDLQKITGEKTFENLTVYEDINVEGKVNSYNLLELYKDTLLTEGDQHVFGMKHLNFAIFLGNVSAKTVNGMELQKHLVTLNTDQEIETSLVFNGDIVVENNLWVQGLINGVNVTQLAEEAVYLDKDETIVGSYRFKSAEVTSNVDVEGLVNGIDLPLLDKNVDAFWTDITQSQQAMDKHSLDSCELANDLQNVLSKSYYILDGFDILKDFNYPASFLQIKSPQEIALINLNDNSSKAIAISHFWNSSANNFLATRYEPTSIAKTLIQNIGGFEVHINIGVLETDSSVTLDGSSLAIPGGFRDAAVLVKDHTEIVLAILFPSKGICETFRMSSLPSTSNLHVESYDKINVGKEATSLALYEIGDVIYLAVSRVYDYPKTGGYSKIYNRISDGWQRFQNIPVFASSYVKHFFYHGFHYLAFSNIAPVHETREPKSIQIFRNSGSNHQWFSLFQKVPFDHSKGLEVFEFGDLSELYLTTWNETRIQIYRLEGESGLKLSFTLHGKCIKDVKPLKIDGDIYLAVGQQNLKNGHAVTSVLYKGLTKGVRYTPHNFKNC